MQVTENKGWILNGRSKLNDIWKRSRPVCMEYSSDLAEKGDSLVASSPLNKIKVTVYGTVKAGKSTLVNALLDKNVAKVGVQPITDRSTPYPWEDAFLCDTPGTAATPEETERALKMVEESHLLLCVIPWGHGKPSDESNWKGLEIAIQRAGLRAIPTIIVLHDLTGNLLKPQDEKTEEEYGKLSSAISSFCSESGIKDPVIMACNAKCYNEYRDSGRDASELEKTLLPGLRRRVKEFIRQNETSLETARLVGEFRSILQDTKELVTHEISEIDMASRKRAEEEERIDSMAEDYIRRMDCMREEMVHEIKPVVFQVMHKEVDSKQGEVKIHGIMEELFIHTIPDIQKDLALDKGDAESPHALPSLECSSVDSESDGKERNGSMDIAGGLIGSLLIPKIAAALGPIGWAVLGVGLLSKLVSMIFGGGGGEDPEKVYALEATAESKAKELSKSFTDRMKAFFIDWCDEQRRRISSEYPLNESIGDHEEALQKLNSALSDLEFASMELDPFLNSGVRKNAG